MAVFECPAPAVISAFFVTFFQSFSVLLYLLQFKVLRGKLGSVASLFACLFILMYPAPAVISAFFVTFIPSLSVALHLFQFYKKYAMS